MKLSKSFMKKLLILVLTAFVVLPIVLMVLGYPKNIITEPLTVPASSELYKEKDGETIRTDDNGYSFHGVDISGVTIPLSDTNTDISLTGLSGEALYCINGVLSCTVTGTDLSFNDSTGLYNYYCNETGGTQSTTSHATCTDSVFITSDKTEFYVPYDINGDNIKHNTLSILETVDSANRSDVSSVFVGFSQPYKYKRVNVEEDVCGNPYLILYDINNGTDVSYISSACYLFNQGNINHCNCNLADGADCDGTTDDSTGDDSTGDDSTGDDSTGDDDDECEGVTQDYCVADFGAQVGDKLCCGQTGVVQKDDRVCPYSKPVCSGFKCGSKWGVCVKKDQ